MKARAAVKARGRKAAKRTEKPRAKEASRKKIRLKDLPKKQRQALLFLPALIAQKGMEAPKFTENAVVVFKSPESCSIIDGKNRFSALFKDNVTYCSTGSSRIIRISRGKIEKI
ncbi:MAG: hypothetical protein QXH30_02010 [Candidatus Bilamarchaeaceae archaeon]